MAKKKQASPPNPLALTPIHTDAALSLPMQELASLEVQLTKADIVKVAELEAKRLLTKQVKEEQDKLQALGEPLSEVRTQLAELFNELDKTQLPRIEEATAPLKAMGFTFEVSAACDRDVTEDKMTDQIPCYFSVRTQSKSSYSNFELSTELPVAVPQGIRDLHERLRDLQAQQQAIGERIAQLRSRMSELPQLAEIGAAQITIAKLAGTEQGKQLLKRLMDEAQNAANIDD